MSSYWMDFKKIMNTSYPSLSSSQSCDVCIVGGGITGIISSYLLAKQGLSVILLERDIIANQTTGHTTAKITSQHSLFYRYLIDTFGICFAQKYLQANEEALLLVEKIVKEENIDCDFIKQDSYVFTQDPISKEKLKNELTAMKELDFEAHYSEKTLPLPIPNVVASISFPSQAQFHPLKYLNGILQFLSSYPVTVYEHTKAIDIKKDGDTYITTTEEGFTIGSKFVIMATKYPFINTPGFYFLKMYQSTSYVVAIETEKNLSDGMYISCDTPTLSFRKVTNPDRNILLVGGYDHKTGSEPPVSNPYDSLYSIAKKMYPDAKLLYQWETEDCISLDKIPYIGPFSNLTPHFYVATGFKKWGMTSSHVAASILVDQICNHNNAYADIFSSTRFHPIQNKDEMKNMLKDSTDSLILQRFSSSDETISSIALNDGKVVEIEGKKVGIYKDSNGNLHAIKPVCSHLGCILEFNKVEKTWDCPCHGSRYDYEGNCIYGPSNQSIPKISIN